MIPNPADKLIMIDVNGIGTLPRDLIIEILSRLPTKILCKFRCVSKQWLQLLSGDKHFIAQHRLQSMAKPLLLFRKYNVASSPSLKDEEMNEYRVVVKLTSADMKNKAGDAAVSKIRATVGGPVNTFTSCGPLVLLCCPYRIYVCNPGTEEFIRVPLSRSVTRYCTVGFGRCSSSSRGRQNNEVFKIVHLFPKDSFVRGKGMGWQVFTITDGEDVNLGSWRKTGECPYNIQTHGLSVCVGGFVYWMVSDEANDLNNRSILSFDLETEHFESIHYPSSSKCCPDFEFEQSSLFLTGFKNHLCLVESNVRTLAANIWVMKDRKRNIWVKECVINLSSLDATGGGGIKICGIVHNDGPEEYDDGGIVMNTERHGLLRYNVKKKTFTRIKTEVEGRYNLKLPCLYYDGFFALR